MQSAVTVVGVTVVVFLALHLTPGDPAAIIAGLQASEAEIQAVRQRFGLDEPLYVQYGTWISRVVRGDFGVSYRGGRSIGPDLAAAYPVSLRLASWAMLVASVVGLPAGVLAASRPNGLSDLSVMALSIAGISIPGFWPSTLTVRERDFVEAARSLGARDLRVLGRHVVPSLLGPLVVQATFSMLSAILNAGALSFLGIGIQPPTPEWGGMLAQGRSYMRVAPHLIVIPGLALALVVFGLNLFGDALRAAYDPRARAAARRPAEARSE